MKKILLSLYACLQIFTALAQPANDEPAGAITLATTSSYFTSTVRGTTIAATKTTLAGSSISVYDDVWYKFEVTGPANYSVSVSLTNVVFSPNIPQFINLRMWNGTLTSGIAGSTEGLYNQFTLGNGTWYLQVYTVGNTSSERSTFDIGIRALTSASPTNNECLGATLLTSLPNTCSGGTLGNNIGATTSTPALANAAANNDVWYKFTAVATKHFIQLSDVTFAPGNGYPNITGLGTSNVNIEIGQGTCGTYSTLGNNVTGTSYETPTLTIGNEYFVRVSQVISAYQRVFDFKIFVTHYLPPANDNVAGAITITPATGNCFTPAGTINGTTIGATPSPQSTCAVGVDKRDVWYNFTASSNFLRVFLDIPEATQTPNIELWNTDATNRILCENSKNLQSVVNSGTNYKIRVIGYLGTSLCSFSLKLLCTVAPQANDNCSTPTTLPLNNNIATVALSGQSTTGASQSTEYNYESSCAGSNIGGDLWYSFTATKNTLSISLRNLVTAGSSNMSMQLFPDCSSTNPITSICGNFLNASTVIGNTYLLRVMKADGCETATFDLHTQLPPSPVNDECATANVLPETTVTNCNSNILKINGSTMDATQSADAIGGSCFGNNNDDVWYRFNIGAGSTQKYGLILTDKLSNIMMFATLQYELYTSIGGCITKTFVECGDMSSFSDVTMFATSATGTYYVRIFSNNAATQFSFKIGLIKVETSTNITCATATTLTATSNMTAAPTFGNTFGVPNDDLDCFGSGPLSRGVWYKFVATATTHLLDIGCVYSLGNGNAFAQAKIYSGSCAALTELFCFNNISSEGGTMTGLTIGQTYSVLVIDFTPNSTPMAFSVRVVGGLPSNDESVAAITLVQDVVCLSSSASTNFSTMSVAPALAAHPLGYSYIGDSWYKFTASTSTVNLTISNNTNDLFVKVYNNALSSLIAYNVGATGAVANGGGSLVLSGLIIGQNYFIRAVLSAPPPGTAPSNGMGRNFNICVWGTPTTIVADEAIGACTLIDGFVTSTNSSVWKHFTHNGKLLASVFDNPGGVGMGVMNGNYYRNVGPIRTGVMMAAGKLLDRNFEITPTTQPTNPVRVKFYYTKQELDALIGNSNLGSPNNLRLIKNSSIPCGSNISSPWVGGSSFYTPTSFGEITPDLLFIEFEFPSFSSMFLGTDALILLPTKIENFTANLLDNKVRLNWFINPSVQISKFEIERSFDGVKFERIGVEGFTGIKEYIYNDAFNKTTTYYRIKMMLENGGAEYSKTVVIRDLRLSNEIVIYPNPVQENNLQISFKAEKAQKIYVQIINNIGKRVLLKELNITAGNHSQTLNIQTLQKGNYFLSVLLDGQWKSKSFTIQK